MEIYDKSATLAEIGSRLRVLRCAAGLSVARAAREAGVSRDTIASYESGKRDPSLYTAIRLIELYRSYGVHIDGVFERLGGDVAIEVTRQ